MRDMDRRLREEQDLEFQEGFEIRLFRLEFEQVSKIWKRTMEADRKRLEEEERKKQEEEEKQKKIEERENERIRRNTEQRVRNAVFNQSKPISRSDESALGKRWPLSQRKAVSAFNSNFQMDHATHASLRPMPKLKIFSVSFKNSIKKLTKIV